LSLTHRSRDSRVAKEVVAQKKKQEEEEDEGGKHEKAIAMKLVT
jgi:hypothetical protein